MTEHTGSNQDSGTNGGSKEVPTPHLVQQHSSNNKMDMTPYDEQRKPHVAIQDGTEVTISPRSLNSELCCPICLDLLKDTMTTKECLHRFCDECITRALKTNKECPTCRKKLVSRRSLRPDTNFNALIAKIYPDRGAYEAMQERALHRFTQRCPTAALQKSIEEGMKAQAQLRRQRVHGSYDVAKRPRKRKEPNAPPVDDSTAVPTQHANNTLAPSQAPPTLKEIELILWPTLKLANNDIVKPCMKQTRYLKTGLEATVEHLSKYLSVRASVEDTDDHHKQSVPDASATTSGTSPTKSQQLPFNMEDLTYRIYIAAKPTITQSDGDPGITPGDVKPPNCAGINVTENTKGPTHGSLLRGDITLNQVRQNFWPHAGPLELVFELVNEKSHVKFCPEKK